MTDEKKPTYANVDEMKFAVAVAEALNTTLGKGDMSYGNYVVSSAQVTFEGDDSVRVVYLDDEYQIEVTQ